MNSAWPAESSKACLFLLCNPDAPTAAAHKVRDSLLHLLTHSILGLGEVYNHEGGKKQGEGNYHSDLQIKHMDNICYVTPNSHAGHFSFCNIKNYIIYFPHRAKSKCTWLVLDYPFRVDCAFCPGLCLYVGNVVLDMWYSIWKRLRIMSSHQELPFLCVHVLQWTPSCAYVLALLSEHI